MREVRSHRLFISGIISIIIIILIVISPVIMGRTTYPKSWCFLLGIIFAYLGLLARSIIFHFVVDKNSNNKPLPPKDQKINLWTTYTKNIYLVPLYSIIAVTVILKLNLKEPDPLVLIIITNLVIGFHTEWRRFF